jgi:hypothetical protein
VEKQGPRWQHKKCGPIRSECPSLTWHGLGLGLGTAPSHHIDYKKESETANLATQEGRALSLEKGNKPELREGKGEKEKKKVAKKRHLGKGTRKRPKTGEGESWA